MRLAVTHKLAAHSHTAKNASMDHAVESFRGVRDGVAERRTSGNGACFSV